MSKNNLVLVTGGAGFIGSHLVDALIKSGYKVRVLDNLAPPTHNDKLPPWFNKKAQFIKGDVRNKKDWQKALRGASYVFHLAAYMDYHLDFSTYFDTNAKSTALLYEVIVKKKLPIKKVIIASSQSVYGEGKYQCTRHGVFVAQPRPEQQLKNKNWEVLCPADSQSALPVAELETDETQPQIPYGISKVAEEKLAITLGRIYRIPTVALRYSIVQGSRQSFRHFYSGALRDFSTRALGGLPIEMQEDGRQIRDFVNVHDVINAHLVVLRNPRANFEVFNAGSGKKLRVTDLAKKVCKMADIPFRPIIQGIFRINAPRHSVMNVDKLKKLGWQPRKSIEDSIREYLGWIKNFPESKGYLQKSWQLLKSKQIIRK